MDSFMWDQQYVTCKVSVGDQTMIWYTFVYTRRRRTDRVPLWENLGSFAESICSPWIVGGHFNTSSHPEEKFGRHRADERATLDFNNFLLRAGLSDAGYSGTKFTWTSNRQGDDNIMECLDYFLVNGEFINAFAFPKVTHLTRNASDHSPILCLLFYVRKISRVNLSHDSTT